MFHYIFDVPFLLKKLERRWPAGEKADLLGFISTAAAPVITSFIHADPYIPA